MQNRSPSFKLEQVPSVPVDHQHPLSFGMLMDQAPGAPLLGDPLITRVCGPELDYGHLFAYCFRRFGYPTTSWDNDKELVAYCLATSHPGLVLRVVPNRAKASSLSLRFLVDDATHEAIDAYTHRARASWEHRAWEWTEKQGLPSWLESWKQLLNQALLEHDPAARLVSDWKESLGLYFPLGAPDTELHQASLRALDFRRTQQKLYSEVEPWPAPYRRPYEIEHWEDEDPLKAVACAAMAALQDLARPVELRDGALTAYQPLNSPQRAAAPARSAGYPCGALGNTSPQEFAQLHSLVLQLGNGNAKRGLKKALASLTAALPAASLTPPRT